MLYTDAQREMFESSYWYNADIVACSTEYVMDVRDADGNAGTPESKEYRNAYIDEQLVNYYNRVDEMDGFLREFITKNRDMLGRVTDETFIKVTALAMSIKYNQLFGVPNANAVEIFNMDSYDLLRVGMASKEDVVMSSPMSFSRFVYTFGGVAGTYSAAFLGIILWLGSFIKPLCTIVVFMSVFLSLFIFKVVLRRESANIIGYVQTVLLLCCTNIAHAIILKVSLRLPSLGLSTTGCLIFMLIGQVTYLLILSYVVGVAARDWQNLGAGIYSEQWQKLKNRRGKPAGSYPDGMNRESYLEWMDSKSNNINRQVTSGYLTRGKHRKGDVT